MAMSGGVDSSVAAAMLVEAGHEVVGVFMRHGSPAMAGSLPVVDAGGKQGCCSVADALDARRVADRLGIPLYPLDLSEQFEGIIDYFTSEYGRGRTPNPCVRCNTWLKFGKLFDYADAISASHVATGHHARLVAAGDGVALHRGRDRGKDQSYVLFEVGANRLGRMLLPVGECTKQEVRQRAAELGLATADKPDSQEICFVAPGRHAELVADRLGGSRAGTIESADGTLLGRHEGIERFTVGQRAGLGIATGRRLYVLRIDAEARRVVVGERSELPTQTCTFSGGGWMVDAPREPLRCLVQCRATQPEAEAVVTPLGQDRFAVEFTAAEPTATISPGQAAVCYDRERLLGGGWIEG